MEENRVLRDDSDRLADLLEGDFVDVNAVDENMTGEYVYNTSQTDGERTFAGAGATDNAYLLSALDLNVHALQDDVSSRSVAHLDVLDLDSALSGPFSCLVSRLGLVFVLNVEQLENLLDSEDLFAFLGRAVQHVCQRVAEALHTLEKNEAHDRVHSVQLAENDVQRCRNCQENASLLGDERKVLVAAHDGHLRKSVVVQSLCVRSKCTGLRLHGSNEARAADQLVLALVDLGLEHTVSTVHLWPRLVCV